MINFGVKKFAGNSRLMINSVLIDVLLVIKCNALKYLLGGIEKFDIGEISLDNSSKFITKSGVKSCRKKKHWLK